MPDSTLKNLQNVAKEVEEMELAGNCQAHVRQQLLEVLYKADELLECLLEDSMQLPP